MAHLRFLVSCVTTYVAILALCSCTNKREPVSDIALIKRDKELSQQQIELTGRSILRLMQSVEMDLVKGKEPEINILMLSGGGSKGAFGAGFLHAWRTEIPEDSDKAFPEFDWVSGISTGSLIAPYAAIGTPEALEEAMNVYRSSTVDWVKVSKLALLSGNESLADPTVLLQKMREELNMNLAQQIADLHRETKRQIIIGSTNMDLSRTVAWSMGEQAIKALELNNHDEFFLPFQASSAIPGIFPPVIIDDSMHVDGAVFGQIQGLHDPRLAEYFIHIWKKKHPLAALPKLRVWIVNNNLTRMGRTIVQPKWSTILFRSNSMMLKNQITEPMNRIALYLALCEERLGMETELNWVAIPREYKAPQVENEFDPKLTNALTELGQQMGSNPLSWKGTADLGIVEMESMAIPSEWLNEEQTSENKILKQIIPTSSN